MGLPDAIGRGPVGESGLVDAVPFVVGLLRTLRKGRSVMNAYMGVAVAALGAALVA